MIEIFDVLIKTKNRLVIADPKTYQDIHGTLEYINLAESVLNRANYEHRMEKGEDAIDDESENRTVYDLSSVQERMYDTNHEEFV